MLQALRREGGTKAAAFKRRYGRACERKEGLRFRRKRAVRRGLICLFGGGRLYGNADPSEERAFRLESLAFFLCKTLYFYIVLCYNKNNFILKGVYKGRVRRTVDLQRAS